MGAIAKYLLFLTGVGARGAVLDHPYVRKKRNVAWLWCNLKLTPFKSTSFFNNNSYTMVTKKEKTETENKYEIFQKAYADANALLSRQFWKNYIILIFVSFFLGW